MSASAWLTLCWNEFTRGKRIDGSIVMLADADLFDAFAADHVCLSTESPFAQRPVNYAMFKSARLYRLTSTGWRVRFSTSLSQDFEWTTREVPHV